MWKLVDVEIRIFENFMVWTFIDFEAWRFGSLILRELGSMKIFKFENWRISKLLDL